MRFMVSKYLPSFFNFNKDAKIYIPKTIFFFFFFFFIPTVTLGRLGEDRLGSEKSSWMYECINDR